MCHVMYSYCVLLLHIELGNGASETSYVDKSLFFCFE